MTRAARRYLVALRMRLRHAMGTNTGKIKTWWHGGYLMVGFRCECGDMHGVHPAIDGGRLVVRSSPWP